MLRFRTREDILKLKTKIKTKLTKFPCFQKKMKKKMIYTKDCHFCYGEFLCTSQNCHIILILLLMATIICGTYFDINRNSNVAA